MVDREADDCTVSHPTDSVTSVEAILSEELDWKRRNARLLEHVGAGPVGRTLLDDTHFGYFDKNFGASRLYDPRLVDNTDPQGSMLSAILHELRTCREFIFSVAFITTGGLSLLKQNLLDFTGKGTVITSTFLDFNSPDAFQELLELPNITTCVLDSSSAFHAKGYWFDQTDAVTAIVGSSNLTWQALSSNREWNLKFSALPGGQITEQLKTALDEQITQAEPLTQGFIDDYAARRRPKLAPQDFDGTGTPVCPPGAITPNAMQEAALQRLGTLVDQGERRALIISATGTGKTILAALAAKQFNPRRLLFVVHREQIVDRAMEEFKKVLGTAEHTYGKFTGSQRCAATRCVFATVQTLSKPDNLAGFAPDAFDYIIIDETHRAAAESYQRIINHFTPDFMLGLTATPERTDTRDVYRIFDYNIAYEIRLQQALDEQLLCPVTYFGIGDYTKPDGTTTGDPDFGDLATDDRVDHIVQAVRTYGHTGPVHGLMFCSSRKEARELSEKLNQRTIRNGKPLRTLALTGRDTPETRKKAVDRLVSGHLDYLLTVDIFNEGIDIREVNQIVLLRRTESAIVLTQQIGRGLRKVRGKDHLRVIDFIGAYDQNFHIARAFCTKRDPTDDDVRRQTTTSSNGGSTYLSIQFDKVAIRRITVALRRVHMGDMRLLNKDYDLLVAQVGGYPKRAQFFAVSADHSPNRYVADQSRITGVDPSTGKPRYCSIRWRNYAEWIHRRDQTTALPAADAIRFLNFLDGDITPGFHAHEALVLKELLASNGHTITGRRVRELVPQPPDGMSLDVIVNHVARILDASYYSTDRLRKRVFPAHGPVAVSDSTPNRGTLIGGPDSVWTLTDEFLDCLRREKKQREIFSFAEHVDDIIDTSLWNARHIHSPAGGLKIDGQYSRRETGRALFFTESRESGILGYGVDEACGVCPIFINYNNPDHLTDSAKYGNMLLDQRHLLWFTKAGQDVSSRLTAAIAGNRYRLPVLIKKDDTDSIRFFYVGDARVIDTKNTTVVDREGKTARAAQMILRFDREITWDTYRYLTDQH